MSMGSPDKSLEEMSGLHKADGSAFVEKLDLNLEASKEGVEGYKYENEACGDRLEVDLNQDEDYGSPSSPADVRFENSESPYTKSSSLVQSQLDHDEEKRTNDYDREKLQSYQCKTEVVRNKISGKFSSPVVETFHSEVESRDPAHHPLVVSSSMGYRVERMDNTPPHDEELNKHAYEEVEDGGSEPLKGKTYDDNETKKDDSYYSCKKPLDNENLEGSNSDLRSPGKTPKRSASPFRQMSVSSQRSPYIKRTAGRRLSSSPQGVQDLAHSPRSPRQRRSPSPGRPGGNSERVHSLGHVSLSARRNSTSPGRRPRQESQQKDDSNWKRQSASPQIYQSPPDRRRQERLVSRSPTRRNDSSSGYRRDNRDRSRSRSPYARDRYRRSPRRRYSPRRRSPPGYHSRRHSPRRRPWSPPPNRSTGIGRPGKNLFVAGFSFVTTERDLERKFSRFGRVRDVRIVRDKRSGDSRGFGFLSLERDEDADAAIRALDQTEWNGRVVLVEKSKAPAR